MTYDPETSDRLPNGVTFDSTAKALKREHDQRKQFDVGEFLDKWRDELEAGL